MKWLQFNLTLNISIIFNFINIHICKTVNIYCKCQSLALCHQLPFSTSPPEAPRLFYLLSVKLNCEVSVSLFSFWSVLSQIILSSVIKMIVGFLFITDKRGCSVVCVFEFHSCVFCAGFMYVSLLLRGLWFMTFCCSDFPSVFRCSSPACFPA